MTKENESVSIECLSCGNWVEVVIASSGMLAAGQCLSCGMIYFGQVSNRQIEEVAGLYNPPANPRLN